MQRYKITRLKPFCIQLEPVNDTNLNVIPIEDLKHLFHCEGLVVLRGFDTLATNEDLIAYSEQWGEVSVWPFGKVLELIQHDEPNDHIFDNSYMPLHWDGMYRPQVPECQIFQCVKAPNPGQGGRTTFSNTQRILEQASAEDLALWRRATGVYERKMAFYNSRTIAPIISEHPYKGYPVIRYNEPHFEEKGELINPPHMQFTGIEQHEVIPLHESLHAALYDTNHFYAHEWQNGDIVINDNFSLLHGRESFHSHSARYIRRVQILSNPPFDNPNLESYQ